VSFTREQKIDLQNRAWELRVAGMTQMQIGTRLNISQSVVSRLLASAREDAITATKDIAGDATTEQIARLDRMLLALWEKVRNGNERAVEAALRVEERRAKLLGLDAATRKAVDLTTGGAPLAYTVQIPVVQRIEGVTAPPVPDDGADEEQPL
jgi:orotate phosphoribosyltransferase-like protein